MALPKPPQNREQWIAAYGKIEDYLEIPESGPRKLSPVWASERLVKVELPFALRLSWSKKQFVTRISVHRYCAPAFEHVFDELDRLRLGVYVYEYGGVFAFRNVRGGSRFSTHAYAAGIDLNPETNPLGAHHGDMRSDVVDVFVEAGFVWGGIWKRPDPMHFQYGYDYDRAGLLDGSAPSPI